MQPNCVPSRERFDEENKVQNSRHRPGLLTMLHIPLIRVKLEMRVGCGLSEVDGTLPRSPTLHNAACTLAKPNGNPALLFFLFEVDDARVRQPAAKYHACLGVELEALLPTVLSNSSLIFWSGAGVVSSVFSF